jgi:hypothetical protein
MPAESPQPSSTTPRHPQSEQAPSALEVWARSAPIRLAGFEEDLAEPHILPSVD